MLCCCVADPASAASDTVILVQDDELDSMSGSGDDDDAADNEDFNEISVPLTVVLSVIGGYIIFGTVLFGLWEGWKNEDEFVTPNRIVLSFCLCRSTVQSDLTVKMKRD